MASLTVDNATSSRPIAPLVLSASEERLRKKVGVREDRRVVRVDITTILPILG